MTHAAVSTTGPLIYLTETELLEPFDTEPVPEIVHWDIDAGVVPAGVADFSNEYVEADAGGIGEIHHGPVDLVKADTPICSIANPFKRDPTTVLAPFTGFIVGVLENPVGDPGNQLSLGLG